MRKRMAMVLASLALSVTLAVPVYAGTWKYVNDQWKYQRSASKYAYNEWIQDNGNWYYIGSDGVMKTGWQQIGNAWYYLDSAGVMQTGWFKDGEVWYFLYPNGVMAVNTVIDGRQIGADGVWIPEEGQTEPVNTLNLSEPVKLMDHQDALSTKGYTINTSGKTAEGERWTNAMRLKGKGSYVQYNTNGEYGLLSGILAPSSQFDSALMARVTVYGDENQVLYTSPDIHYNEKAMTFGVDISGQNQIRVEVSLVKDNEWDDPVILLKDLALYR
ncbi:MAG: NPCBM/NEW2 domain-containing protein [Enterocloster sp.]